MDKAPLSGQQFLLHRWAGRMVFPWLRDSAGSTSSVSKINVQKVLKVLSIGSSSRAQSWRFLEKLSLPLWRKRLLHDSVHRNSSNSDDPGKKNVQTASGWYDTFIDIIWLRFPNCLSTIFSVGSSQHCCSSAVISRRQFRCLPHRY